MCVLIVYVNPGKRFKEPGSNINVLVAARNHRSAVKKCDCFVAPHMPTYLYQAHDT